MSDTPSPEFLQRVAAACGRAPETMAAVTAGFTRAGRWRVTFADGGSAFVKGAADDETAAWLRAEHRIYAAVAADFLPKMLGWHDDGARPVLVLEDLSRAVWPPPWTMGPIRAVKAALARVAATPPPPGVPALEDARDEIASWGKVAADPKPFLALGLCSEAWLQRALQVFQVGDRIALLDGTELVHLDVRSDNICFVGDRVVFVDWNWARRGNARVDLAFWAPSLCAEGGPQPEETCPGPPELASLVAGYFAARAGLPEDLVPPGVRNVQRRQLERALPWAARAFGLPEPDGAKPRSTGDTRRKEEWIF